MVLIIRRPANVSVPSRHELFRITRTELVSTSILFTGVTRVLSFLSTLFGRLTVSTLLYIYIIY